MKETFDTILKAIQAEESAAIAQAQEKAFEVSDENLELCGRSHAYFQTKACVHYLTECNLCHQMTFCAQHGCSFCNLKAKDDFQALSATPEKERDILIEVSQRPLPKRKVVKRKKYANQRNHREAWLDDLIASQE